jgi:hypothetical protein
MELAALDLCDLLSLEVVRWKQYCALVLVENLLVLLVLVFLSAQLKPVILADPVSFTVLC